MDALALLCTLHADGPRTTRRLRDMGIHDLDHLQTVPVSQLAETLDASQKAAERFLREASLLKKRVRHEAVDDSGKKARSAPAAAPREAPPVARSSTARTQVPAASAPKSPAPASPYPRNPAPATPAFPTSPRVEPVVSEAPREPESSASQPEASPPNGAEELKRFVIHPRMRDVSGPLEIPSDGLEDQQAVTDGDGGRVLRPGLFEGLDAIACDRLRATGIETVETLAGASGLDLALELGWAYDRVFHLKKEASHFLQSLDTAREVPTAPVEDEGASGPFA